jgi:hypothetical protein
MLIDTLKYLFPKSVPGVDYVLQDDGEGAYIKSWNMSAEQPTTEQLSTAAPAAAQAQALIQAAQSMLSEGIAVVSTGTPTLNATYACDQLSQVDIIAVETSINAGKGFPGGAATFSYPDATGVMHSFSEPDFTEFAAAVRDYVYALKSVIAGASTTLPGPSTSIV